MNKLVSLCLLFFMLPTLVFTQKYILPSAEEKVRAEALRETYSEEELVILNKLKEFTFGYNDKSEKVEVRASSKKRLMSIGKMDHRETFAEFYDEESEIEKIEVFNKKKKKVTIYVKDDYYQSDDFFYTDARVKYFNLNFSEAGFQYQVNADKLYKDIKYFTSAYFSDAYPVESTTLRFIISRWLDLELKGFNFEGYDIKKEVTYDSKTDTDVYEFTLNNLAARSTERFSPGPSHVYPHVLVIAKSFLKDNKTIPLFGTTEDLYGWYSSLVNGMEDDSGVLNDKVAELIKRATTDQEKVEAIYYWVQDNVRYIAFEDGIAGFRPELCQNVFKNKYGITSEFFDFLTDINFQSEAVGNQWYREFLIAYFDRMNMLANVEDTQYAFEYDIAKDYLTGKALAFYRSEIIARAFRAKKQDLIIDRYYQFVNENEYTQFDAKVLATYAKAMKFAKGTLAPDFMLQDIEDKTLTLASFAGKAVYLNFWATWCKPCMKKMQETKSLQAELEKDGIVFLNISLDRKEEIWKETIEKNKFKGIHVLATGELNSEIAKAYEVRVLPQYFIINKKGEFVQEPKLLSVNDLKTVLVKTANN